MSCPWQGRLTVEQAERGDSTVKNQYLALDYGGTFTKYALMDREGRFLCEGKVPSACDSLEHMLACVAPLQEQFQGQYDGVAVSMPGRIDTARGVACTGGSFHFIRNTPIQHCLEKIFQAPVTVANDGKCAASAEAWSGALAGVEDGAVILLGTGTGGLVLGGHVRMGCTFGAGEFSFLGADLGRLSEGLVKGGPYREAVWVDYMSATGLLRLYGRQKGAAGALPDMDGIGFFLKLMTGVSRRPPLPWISLGGMLRQASTRSRQWWTCSALRLAAASAPGPKSRPRSGTAWTASLRPFRFQLLASRRSFSAGTATTPI